MIDLIAKRGTGRSTRLLKEAIRIATEGHRYCFVIVANKDSRAHLQKQCAEMCDGRIGGDMKVYPKAGGQISFETPESNGAFDWRQLKYPGAHPSCEVLIDHFAIESQWGFFINTLESEWKRFG